jgi:hypothetical protein
MNPTKNLIELKLYSQKWARTLPSLIYFSLVIYRVPPQIQISKKYIRIAAGIVRGEQRGAGHYACVTGIDVTGSGPDCNDVA